MQGITKIDSISEIKKGSIKILPFYFCVLEAGLEPAHPRGHYPLKIACLPGSTTPAYYCVVSVGVVPIGAKGTAETGASCCTSCCIKLSLCTSFWDLYTYPISKQSAR